MKAKPHKVNQCNTLIGSNIALLYGGVNKDIPDNSLNISYSLNIDNVPTLNIEYSCIRNTNVNKINL